MNTNTVEKLQANHVAGDRLSSKEEKHFLQWLRDDPTARRELLKDEAMDSQLHCLARLHDDEAVEIFVGDTIRRAIYARHRDDLPPIIRTVDTKPPRPFRLSALTVSLVAAVVAFLGTAITWYSTTQLDRNDFGFATITGIEDLSWELMDAENRRLRVTSGSGEIHFNHGAVVRLAAPAEIELETENRLFLKDGSIKIDVPPAAVGFTVETPHARIVDFGTSFDVDVHDAGRTDTIVRSGTVTFEAHPMERALPVKLTADGLNRASAVATELTTDVQSIATTASGRFGGFYGTIHADGNTAEFHNRRDFVEFLRRLHEPVHNPSQLREQWEVIVETTANGTSTMVESSGGTGIFQGSSAGEAQELLIDQLRSMQGMHQGNRQMEQVLELMILQLEETLGDKFE